MPPVNSTGLCVSRHKVSGRNSITKANPDRTKFRITFMYHRRFTLIVLTVFWSVASVAAQSTRSPRIAVLDLGNAGFGAEAADALRGALSLENQLVLLDRDQARAAARGIGYTGSLNMTLAEARDLGAAIGCDFFVTGVAETLRRSAS